MALFYEEEAAFDVEFDAKEVAEAVINQVADMEDVPYEFDGDKHMQYVITQEDYDIYPKKQVVDILWTDIASVRIFTDKLGNLYTHEILMIEKTDNTKEYLKMYNI